MGKYVAIVLDNVLVSAPRVNEVIPNGNASITGNFTTETAKALQIQLDAGALPVPLTVLQQQTSRCHLRAGIFAEKSVCWDVGFCDHCSIYGGFIWPFGSHCELQL